MAKDFLEQAFGNKPDWSEEETSIDVINRRAFFFFILHQTIKGTEFRQAIIEVSMERLGIPFASVVAPLLGYDNGFLPDLSILTSLGNEELKYKVSLGAIEYASQLRSELAIMFVSEMLTANRIDPALQESVIFGIMKKVVGGCKESLKQLKGFIEAGLMIRIDKTRTKGMRKALISAIARQISKPSVGSFTTKNLDPEDLIDIYIRYEQGPILSKELLILIKKVRKYLSKSLLCKTLIFYEIEDVLKKQLKKMSQKDKSRVIPDIFAYSLIIRQVKYSFMIFENYKLYIHDAASRSVLALITSLQHGDKYFEERLFLIFKLREFFNFKDCTAYLD